MQLEHILAAHGLIGRGGGKSKDDIPPPPITNFQATVAGETIKLIWSNPKDTDYIGLLIVGENNSYPTGINDGDIILNENIEGGGTIPTEVVDSNITLGVRRYYRAFPYDWDRNYQTDTGQQANAIVKLSQAAPSAPTMTSRSSTSITLNAISGCEYRIGSGAWQDSVAFSGLSIATSYTFYARRKETDTHYASPASASATFTTDKGTQAAPAAPNVTNIEWDRATVTGVSGTEVRLGSGTWYDSPHTFTGLTEATAYQAYARYKETNTHYASPASAAKGFTTPLRVPGPATLIAGDMQAGFFGEVSASELISGTDLASLVGISQGTSQNSTVGWLKFAWQGKILFVAKKPIRNSISWDHINSANAVYGSKSVVIDGLSYKIRLLKGALTDPSEYQNADRGAHGSEWNRLMLPIHQEAIDKSWAYPAYVESNIPVWAHSLGTGVQGRYTDEDLLTHYDHGSGSYSWCQETRKDYTALRALRGGSGVSRSDSGTSSGPDVGRGWRPCLEFSV